VGSFGRLDHNVEAAIGDEKKYIRLNANRSESNSYQDGDGKTIPSNGNVGMLMLHWVGHQMKTLG
jgi:hypothetical protein